MLSNHPELVGHLRPTDSTTSTPDVGSTLQTSNPQHSAERWTYRSASATSAPSVQDLRQADDRSGPSALLDCRASPPGVPLQVVGPVLPDLIADRLSKSMRVGEIAGSLAELIQTNRMTSAVSLSVPSDRARLPPSHARRPNQGGAYCFGPSATCSAAATASAFVTQTLSAVTSDRAGSVRS